MKVVKSSKISRQTIYLLVVTIVLLIGVFLFSFYVLIPTGKDYRYARGEKNKKLLELAQYQGLHDDTLKQLKRLEEKNRLAVSAFDNSFDQEKFIAQNKKFFEDLMLSKISKAEDKNPFDLYEVNATSKIYSPVVFYNFLESLNKGDWIIGVNFPIHFKREDEMITTSFTMRVYKLSEKKTDVNTTK